MGQALHAAAKLGLADVLAAGPRHVDDIAAESDTCIRLLQRCRDVIPADGRLLVVDPVVPPGNEPHPAKIVDIVMMGVLTGRERTEQELAALLAAAGFDLNQVTPTHSMLAIVEGIPT